MSENPCDKTIELIETSDSEENKWEMSKIRYLLILFDFLIFPSLLNDENYSRLFMMIISLLNILYIIYILYYL